MQWRNLHMFVALILVSATAAGEPALVLNNTNGPPFTTAQGDGFLDRVTQTAFARYGERVRLVMLPAERGLRSANAGIEDGDLTRIAGIKNAYPNLLPVPEKLMDWSFSAFSHKPMPTLSPGWDGLLPYRVGIIRGWKIAETQLARAKGLVFVDDVEQLFRLLEKKRVDAVVYSREMGLWYLQQQKLKNIHLIEPPLDTRAMFIYLHKRHAALAPKLAEALRALKADGSYDRWYRESVTRRLAPAP